MNLVKIVAIALIIAGGLGLAYGNFSYTKDTQQAQLGPLQLTVKEQQTVNIPIWLGAAALGVGIVLLVLPGKN